MSSTYAKIILDSISPANVRITTVEVRYWRAIHSEVMTHRDRARNAASSRAIPFYREKDGLPVVNCTYSYIQNDPFFPMFIGAEQKGMQSGDELGEPNRSDALKIIDDMRLYNLEKCKQLSNLDVHKSIINRYLEPWSYITVVMTATRWRNFFRLRVHPDAEKHFNHVATLIKSELVLSVPQRLKVGEWHTPYIQPDETLFNVDLRTKVSAARCARVSYLTQDGRRNIADDLSLFKRLIERSDDVIHSSPLEHVAEAKDDPNYCSGPFNGWHQLRKNYHNEDLPG